jgi:hypothetical protein
VTDEHTEIPQEPAAPQGPAPGDNFALQVDEGVPLEEVRKMIRDRLKFEGHIKAKVGPFAVTAGKIIAPVEAVDDPYLMGRFPINLTAARVGFCVYFGVLKEDPPPQTA